MIEIILTTLILFAMSDFVYDLIHLRVNEIKIKGIELAPLNCIVCFSFWFSFFISMIAFPLLTAGGIAGAVYLIKKLFY